MLDAPDLELVASVSRSAAGSELGGAPVYGTVAEALEAGVDVLIDYTSHEAAKAHALTALGRGVRRRHRHLRLTAERLRRDRRRPRGTRASAPSRPATSRSRRRWRAPARCSPRATCRPGRSSTTRRRRSPTCRAGRRGSSPSGSSAVAPSPIGRPLDEIAGPVEARGATVGAGQVHSVRLPGFVVSTEIVFGLADERLTIRHDAGGTPQPYVAGTLLAARAVQGRAGLTRGLDALLLGG